jgi:hypothetical protein
MFRKTVVRFPADGGIELSAWLFVPDQQAAPLPAIKTASHAAIDWFRIHLGRFV